MGWGEDHISNPNRRICRYRDNNIHEDNSGR
jgi:hypothetical protein